jgi:hypothetical protein
MYMSGCMYMQKACISAVIFQAYALKSDPADSVAGLGPTVKGAPRQAGLAGCRFVPVGTGVRC